MSREDRAREFIDSLRGENRENAIRQINDELERYKNSKRNSNYGPEMNEIERAISILYRGLEAL